MRPGNIPRLAAPAVLPFPPKSILMSVLPPLGIYIVRTLDVDGMEACVRATSTAQVESMNFNQLIVPSIELCSGHC